MDWWLITFLLGALLSLFLPIVPTLFYVLLFITLSLISYFFVSTRKFAGVLAGCAWLLWHASIYQAGLENQQKLITDRTSQQVSVQGEIDDLPQVNKGTQRFNFIISHVEQEPLPVPIRVRLSWKENNQHGLTKLLSGQVWQLKVRLKPAHGLANLGGFSYQTWLRKNQITSTGYVVNTQKNLLIKNTPTYRQLLYQQFERLLPKDELSPLILALSFGERSKLTKKHWRTLQATATQHLIAISGLHLGLIAGAAYVVFNILIRVVPIHLILTERYQLAWLKFNNCLIVILLTCLFTFFYAYLAGFSLPTSRALLMILIYWLARLFSIKLSPSRLILVTLVVIIIIFPFSLFSSSFWLSFYAVSIIFILLWRFNHIFAKPNKENVPRINRLKSWFIALFYLQLMLILLMLPITILLSYQLPLLSLPANLIAVPWMSITSIPLSLLAVLVTPFSENLATFFSHLSLTTLHILWWFLDKLTNLSLVNVAVSNVQWIFIFLTVVVLFLLVFLMIPLRYLSFAIFSLVITFFISREKLHNEQSWFVNIMDVGQGLAVVIEKNNQVMIYDTGASYPSGFSMAEAVLIPYLKYQGYQSLERLIISHDDNDHAGGLAMLSNQFPIKTLMYNTELSMSYCIAGNSFQWQELTIEVLWPNQIKSQENNDSCVIKISDNKYSVLLTGDISKKIEQQLIQAYQPKNTLKSDVLVVPHHGSKTSSSIEFINAISPQYAIFSAGYLNRWRMPVSHVVKRYQDKGVTTFKTANTGMIRFSFLSNQIKKQTYRHDFWPYWFANN